MKDTYKKNFFNIISNPLKTFFTKTIYDDEINYKSMNKLKHSLKINSLINLKIDNYQKNPKNCDLLKNKEFEKKNKNFVVESEKNKNLKFQTKKKTANIFFKNLQKIQKLPKLKKIQIPKEEKSLITESDQDFDSGEEIYLKKTDYKKMKKKLNFFQKTNKNKKIKKVKKKHIINLLEFIKNKNSARFLTTRMYICKFCDAKFLRASALGGHTSKHHPNLSKDYKYRTLSIKNRKIERKRIEYFNSLE